MSEINIHEIDITFVKEGTPAAELFRRICQAGRVNSGAIFFVTPDEYESLNEDFQIVRLRVQPNPLDKLQTSECLGGKQ